jgi:hypothetical protein
MADHFGVIGFKMSAAELSDLVGKLPATGKSQPCSPGIYYRWQSDVGPELWIHMAKEIGSETLTIEGVTPFFAGEGELPVRVMKLRRRPTDNAFEGVAFVEVAPGVKPHECATVALVDVVDYACWMHRVPPFLATAQVAAFPHSLAVFMDEETFALAQAKQSVRFAAESLFASGLFESNDESDDAPTFHDPEAEVFRGVSRAFFTGRVLKAETRRNPVTDQEFRWALVRTLGGTMDVLADAAFADTLRPGVVIQGEFYLCAKLTDIAALPANGEPIEADAQASPSQSDKAA